MRGQLIDFNSQLINGYTIDNFDKNSDDSTEVEVFGKCQEPTKFPLDVMARTVNPIYLKPNPLQTNYIPPKPKVNIFRRSR